LSISFRCNYYNTSGITLFETNISANDKDIVNQVLLIKQKIRLDNGNWYNQMILANYVLYKTQSEVTHW